MMRDAWIAACRGDDVYVITHSHAYEMVLAGKCAEENGLGEVQFTGHNPDVFSTGGGIIRFRSSPWPPLDWESLSLKGFTGGSFLDNHAIEERHARVLRELHRWDE